MNTDTDMDFFELVLFDVLIVLIFACFLVTAVFFTGNNLFIINLSLVFGAITIPFSRFFSGWWTYLRYHEREKAKIIGKNPARWMFFDFGLKGNTWMFRIISLVTTGFALYNLVMFFVENGWR
jgi:hypothetical protein